MLAGNSNIAVAEEQNSTPTTVIYWRKQFIKNRIAGLFDKPRPGRPLRHEGGKSLRLTEEEFKELNRLVRRRTVNHALAIRASIILECAKGTTNKAVSRNLNISAVTVSKWRNRFLKDRVDGLVDEPRPGIPPNHF